MLLTGITRNVYYVTKYEMTLTVQGLEAFVTSLYLLHVMFYQSTLAVYSSPRRTLLPWQD